MFTSYSKANEKRETKKKWNEEEEVVATVQFRIFERRFGRNQRVSYEMYQTTST